MSSRSTSFQFSFFKFFTLFLFALSLASCLGDDDDDPTDTIKDYGKYTAMMAGSYTGYLYFYNDSLKTDNTDSIWTEVQVGQNDSVIHLRNVPQQLLLKGLPIPAAVAAAEQAPKTDLTLGYILYQQKDNLISFGVYPQEKTFTLRYDGENHTVKATFMNYINTMGFYANDQIEITLFQTKIEIDNLVYKSYEVSSAYVDSHSMLQFYGKKKW